MTAGAARPEAGDPLREAADLLVRIHREGPWESAQTHGSLVAYLREETEELAEAIETGDRDALVSELGDLLLQVLFHAAIGAGRAERPFDVDDVAEALLAKLRRRAPYWFDGGPVPATADEQDRIWAAAKAAERAATGAERA